MPTSQNHQNTSSTDAVQTENIADANIAGSAKADSAIDVLTDASLLNEDKESLGQSITEQALYLTQDASEQLEETTNQTLQFLGIPVDVDTLIMTSSQWGGRIFWALVIFFVGKWIGKRVVRALVRTLKRSHMDETAVSFLSNVLYGLMFVMVSLAALNKLGVNTNSFVAVLGAIGVAIGVALKDQIGNLAAGVMIVIFRPFGRGDYVEIGGKVGTVTEITLVNTRIVTPNNHEVIIPNGDIMTSASINYTSIPRRRLEIEVGIGYDDDIKTARDVMIQAAYTHPNVLQDPAAVARVTELGDNAVQMILYVWTQNDDWWATQCDVLEMVKYALDEAGIDIPYPQRNMHISGVSADKINAFLNQDASSVQ